MGWLSKKHIAKEHAQPEVLYEGSGMIWKLMRCSIKPYACCRGTHSCIDATIQLMEEANFPVDEIKAVKVRLSPFLYNMCGTRDLSSLASAQMSLPYALNGYNYIKRRRIKRIPSKLSQFCIYSISYGTYCAESR